MTTLTFKSKEFPRMLEFMRNNDRKVPYGENTKDFGLHLVKDDGIYLMAGTVQADWMKHLEKCHVIYAQGFSPKTKDLWEKCRSAVGGDDFVEWIPLSNSMVNMLARSGHMKIKFTPKEIEINVYG
jgi:hypothetical protein|tara:strand:+ start:1199 stop:1576 length:378 start_codon:yes stop_codon:yes gene_type:complete